MGRGRGIYINIFKLVLINLTYSICAKFWLYWQNKRLTSNGPYQGIFLLTAEATQLAWRASVDSILAAAVKSTRELMSFAAPVYADAPIEKQIIDLKNMYHLHTKNEDLTDAFKTLAKKGKRTNIMVWAIQRKFLNSPKSPFQKKKKNAQIILARLSRLTS